MGAPFVFMARVPIALTIAGSDSGGGAGIQADLKTFSALGVYGASAITAVTAQDTQRVYDFIELTPEFIAKQIDAVMDDIGADAVKTRIKSILATPALNISKVDRASNSLPQLARDFTRDNTLLRALLRAIQLAGVLLALLHLAAPWLVPTLAIAYVLAIGTTVLVGRQYTGAGCVLAWIDGVEQVAGRIP